MQQNYFAATDEERKNELQAMLDDASVQAILCARGGYGVSKIIDGISFTQAGIVEVIEKQQDGYIGITAY